MSFERVMKCEEIVNRLGRAGYAYTYVGQRVIYMLPPHPHLVWSVSIDGYARLQQKLISASEILDAADILNAVYSPPDGELQNCPFCGREASLSEDGAHDYVKCDTCGARSSKCYSVDVARSLWNVRLNRKK